MTERKRSLLADVKDEIGSLAVDLREMAALRFELARLEFRAAAGQMKRLAIVLLVAGVLAVSALPILAVGAAELLLAEGDRWLGISRGGWLLLFGCGLLLGGVAGGYLVWRRFRRHFAGMEQTLEELREDVAWLKEWTRRGKSEDNDA